MVTYYIIFILIATLLLKLPFIFNEGMSINWLEAFFTSNSSVATSGLTLFNYQEVYNYAGWFVLIILFNLGGMGILVFNTALMLFFGKKLGFRYRYLTKLDVNQSNSHNIGTLAKGVAITFITVELIGAFLIFIFSFGMFPDLASQIMNSLFLSASAVSGSGFYDFSVYINNFPVIWITIVLMIFSFIGYPVIMELIWWYQAKRKGENFVFSSFTKIVVNVNLITIALFAFLFFSFEVDNSMSGLTLFQQINASIFTSISTKSVGLSVFSDVSTFTTATLFLNAIFMIIGGSPSSACGGVKVVSIYIIYKYIVSTIKGDERVIFYNKRLSSEAITKSFLLVFSFVAVTIIATFLISLLHPNLKVFYVWYDVVSGFTTTGFSTGVTGSIGGVSIFIMALLMGIGRIGIMNLMNYAKKDHGSNIEYLEVDIAI